MEQQIPAEISAIIDEWREKMRKAEEMAEEEARQEKARECEEIQAAWSSVLVDVSEALPDIVAYVRKDNLRPYERGETIIFDIPGLTPIRTLAVKKDVMWVVSGKFDVKRYEEDYEAGLIERWWWEDLELADALLKAAEAEKEHQRFLELYAQRRADAEKAAWERERIEANEEARENALTNAAVDERERLLATLADDPVVLALLNVFVKVRAERDGYESQIEMLNENLYELDERSSRRIGEVKQEAERARREASEARQEVDDKVYELAAAENKLKKATRGY